MQLRKRHMAVCVLSALVVFPLLSVQQFKPTCGVQNQSTLSPNQTITLKDDIREQINASTNSTEPTLKDDMREQINASTDSIEPEFVWNQNSHTDKCFYVESICHSSQRWFYRTNQTKKQPKVLLYRFHQDRRNDEHPYPQTYTFEHADVNATQHCVDSPITNHFVTFSLYNEMLAEFYVRELYFRYVLSQQGDWMKFAQHYIHLYAPNRPLLESHHLFTSPFRTLPLLDFTSLLDEAPCSCLPRLILCGYAVNNDPNEENSFVLDPNDLLVPEAERNFAEFRNYLRKHLIDDNSHVQHDIQQYRKQLFDKQNVPLEERQEWKIVGLAQRNIRRSWRDLPTVITETQTRLVSSKIVLVEMNLESKMSNAYQQLIRHGAIDALVGIHGSQLPQAVWMKPQSWVVELLLYIPKGMIMGSWGKTTDRPTPLGIEYDNTDLNHVGYPLQRNNSPYCHEEEENPEIIDKVDCWWKHQWDHRDFILSSEALEKILRGTILLKESSTCQDYLEMAGKDWVLYNINCADGNDTSIETHHYYWNATE